MDDLKLSLFHLSFCLLLFSLLLSSCSLTRNSNSQSNLECKTCKAIDFFLSENKHYAEEADYCAIGTKVAHRVSDSFILDQIIDINKIVSYSYSPQSWNSIYKDQLKVELVNLADTIDCKIPTRLNGIYKEFDSTYDYLRNKNNVLFFSPLVQTNTKGKYYMRYYSVRPIEGKLYLFHFTIWIYFKKNKVIDIEETDELYGGIWSNLSGRLEALEK